MLSRTIIVIIAIITAMFLIILSIRSETIAKYSYSAIILYEHYKLKKELKKELDEKWEKQQEEIEKEIQLVKEQIKQENKLLEELHKKYENDHYGGKTPEETLALFIEALKKKDYKLASKYYVAEKWVEKEKFLNEWITHNYDNVNQFIRAYETGQQNKKVTKLSVYIYIYSDEMKYPYKLKFKFNKLTGVWKIYKF